MRGLSDCATHRGLGHAAPVCRETLHAAARRPTPPHAATYRNTDPPRCNNVQLAAIESAAGRRLTPRRNWAMTVSWRATSGDGQRLADGGRMTERRQQDNSRTAGGRSDPALTHSWRAGSRNGDPTRHPFILTPGSPRGNDSRDLRQPLLGSRVVRRAGSRREDLGAPPRPRSASYGERMADVFAEHRPAYGHRGVIVLFGQHTSLTDTPS